MTAMTFSMHMRGWMIIDENHDPEPTEALNGNCPTNASTSLYFAAASISASSSALNSISEAFIFSSR